MEIVIADYEAGYERSIMIDHTFYPIEKIKRNLTEILGYCYAGRYSALYKELLKTLDILGITTSPGPYYTITIVEDAHISRIYYYNPSRKKNATKFDVVKPNFSIIYQDLIL